MTSPEQKPINTMNMMSRAEFEAELDVHLAAIESNIEVTLWGALVCPLKARSTSSGGIALTSQTQDAEQYLNYIGKLIKVGPAYYESMQLAPYKAHAPRIGDYVMYKQYAGKRVDYRGIGLLLLDDDQMRMVVKDVDNFRIYL